MNKQLSAAEASKGHNRPPVLTPDEIARDFAYLDTGLNEVEKKVSACPPVIEDDEDLELARTAVRLCQGAHKRLEAVRVEAKEPFLAATRIVDSHFNTRKERVAKWQSGIEARAKRYLDKKAAEERAIREEEARRAAEEARKAQEAARKAEEDRIALERQAEADAEAAEAARYMARQEETRLREAALQTTATALKAKQETEAKPAELARTRTGDGLSTLAEIWCFEVIDPHAVKLDDPVLRSFIPWPEIEKAIARYTKLHKGDRPLDGVRFYQDTKVMMS